MYILKKDIKLYDEIPSWISNLENYQKLESLNSGRDVTEYIYPIYRLQPAHFNYTNLQFFKNWLVGFTLAEGSFLIKSNNDGCFQLKQKIHSQLFESFKLIFETNRKITIEKNKYNQFSVCSKFDIQKVINFFSFSGLHPLIGLKSIQYLNWLNKLKISSRYKNLNFPII
jgi:hypothetical protein